MAYLVLARKLRPRVFNDLIGQQTTSRILKNAIASNRVAHAYLFTGSRGTGKTSTARILTKAINCLDPQDYDPCNVCENCTEIEKNASSDVYEIDAASNRGIENIRELRQNIHYTPLKCKYKVYIIDEAHMLTIESFNALLKTLEEPPEHVKFILATTDPHKLPQTILSRTQRFDFNRIDLKSMVEYLAQVCIDEKITIETKALEMIAKNASGGMRDALSSLDQVISFSDQNATVEQSAQILGIIESKQKVEFLKALFNRDATEAFKLFTQIHNKGLDLNDILTEMLKSISDISAYKAIGAEVLSEHYADHEIEELKTLAENISETRLQIIFKLLLNLEETIKKSSHAHICFEMALFQITSINDVIGVADLLKVIRNLKLGVSTSNQSGGQQNNSNNNTYSASSGNQNEIVENIENKNENLLSRTASNLNLPSANMPQNFELPDVPDWENIVAYTQTNNARVGSILRHALPIQADQGHIHISFKDSKYYQIINDDLIKTINQVLSQYKDSLSIEVDYTPHTNTSVLTLSEQDKVKRAKTLQEQKDLAIADANVVAILKTFADCEMIDIDLSATNIEKSDGTQKIEIKDQNKLLENTNLIDPKKLN